MTDTLDRITTTHAPSQRRRDSFDGNWHFRRGELPIRYAVKAGMTGGMTDCGTREDGEWLDIAFVDRDSGPADPEASEWRQLNLPHDWGVEGQYTNDPGLGSRDGSHGYLPVGIGFYRKRFTIPAEDLGKRISLQFDGVTGRAELWLNGHLVGEHFGGTSSFGYDIGDLLRYGTEGDNVVLVKVDATVLEGWWYEGCGIYRHVWLQRTDPLHIADNGTYVTTPEIAADGSSAVVAVATTVRNESNYARRFRVRTSLYAKSGGDVLAETLSETVALSPYSDTDVSQRMTLAAPALWSPEQPNLYRAVSSVEETIGDEGALSYVKLGCDSGNGDELSGNGDGPSADPAAMGIGQDDASNNANDQRSRPFELAAGAFDGDGVRLADRYETVFGVRSLAFLADQGFLLNDEPYPIRGTSNHQDFAGVGVALPDALIAYKLKLLKEMGCNAYRSAHHPPTPELLALCDELGLLVMNENRKLDSTPRGLDHLRRMILRDRNHPCIILWSLENEEVLEGTATGSRILKRMAGEARRLDPARPTVAAMNHGWHEGDYADQVDIVGYNYGHRGSASDGRRRFPHRAQIGSESASYTTTRGEYADDPAAGYVSSYGTGIPSWGCSPAVSWQAVLDDPSLTGVFLWTGFDYRGEPTPYEWPCINSHFGIMDTCGFPKDVYYEVQAMWTANPLVHVMPHWNWAGREGEEIEVWTSGNCDSVELWLNGKLLGEQAREGLSPIKWAVPYEPGTLRAIGKNGGIQAASTERITAGAASRIVLEADRMQLRGDGTDVAVLRVSVVDAAGHIMPTADSLIRFELSGPAVLLGVGNGNPSSHEPDKADRRRAFNGRCLALVQPSKLSSESSAVIRVRAVSPGLASAEITLTAANGAAEHS